MIAVNQESELRTSVAPLVELLDAISMWKSPLGIECIFGLKHSKYEQN